MKGPGLCTRHVDKTYKSIVSVKREVQSRVQIGSVNEIILWSEEVSRLYSDGLTEQVCVFVFACMCVPSHVHSYVVLTRNPHNRKYREEFINVDRCGFPICMQR